VYGRRARGDHRVGGQCPGICVGDGPEHAHSTGTRQGARGLKEETGAEGDRAEECKGGLPDSGGKIGKGWVVRGGREESVDNKFPRWGDKIEDILIDLLR
jgi:hypothetical protein